MDKKTTTATTRFNSTLLLRDSPHTKSKGNKWDNSRLRSFCIAKETISKMTRTYQMEENICKSYLRWN